MVSKPRMFTSKKVGKIEQSRTTVFIVVIVASIFVSFSLVSSKFLFDKLRFNLRVIDEQNRAVQQIESNIETIGELSNSYTSFELEGEQEPSLDQPSARQVLDGLPSKYDFPALASSVQGIVSNAGLSLVGFQGEDLESEAVQSEQTPSSEVMPFTIEVQGSYENVQRLFNMLDRSIRPMKVVSASFSGSDDNMTVEIQIESYYQPEQSLDYRMKEVN